MTDAEMNEPICLECDLTEEMWRQFHDAHYAADHRIKVRFWYGAAMVAVGSFGLGGLFENRLIALALILFGLYCVLARQILVVKSLRKAKRNPSFLGRVRVRIDREGIAVERQGARHEQPWSAFIGYRKAAPGFLFYVNKNSFFFIPKEAISPEDTGKLQRILDFKRLQPL